SGTPSEDCTTGLSHAAGSHAIDTTTGIAHPSSSTGALGAGSYAFRASLAADSNYTVNGSATSGSGACEPFTVAKGNLTIATTVHTDSPDAALSGSAPLGTSLHDSALISGLVTGFAPANSVTFTW